MKIAMFVVLICNIIGFINAYTSKNIYDMGLYSFTSLFLTIIILATIIIDKQDR